MSETFTKCTICDTTMIGEYCHVCGQRNTAKKITFFGLLGDFISGFFSLEHSVTGTFWTIIRQPAAVIKNYWTGFRGYYQSPGKLAFYAAFVIGLHFAFVGNELLGISLTFTNISIPPQLMLLLLLIPVYSLVSKITFFKQKRSYLEHLIAMIYLFSTWIVIFIIVDYLQILILGKLIDEGMLLLFIIVLLVWTARVHSPIQRWNYVLVYTLIEIIVLILIITLFFVLIYYIYPEGIQVDQTGV